ncbi:MAG: 4Fe-4S binding protein [Dehalococcoidales bacterium]|nr:4Fe-4S binding protein [Dehalococcoidales bacterium]
MAYKINQKKCLKCGLCVTECPEKAIVVDDKVTEDDGLVLYTVRIDPDKCTECGVCVSYEWWCPAKAIVKA